MQRVYEQFSAEVREAILRNRSGKLSAETDLSRFYIGEEAVRAGLADSVDRIHLAIARESLSL